MIALWYVVGLMIFICTLCIGFLIYAPIRIYMTNKAFENLQRVKAVAIKVYKKLRLWWN